MFDFSTNDRGYGPKPSTFSVCIQFNEATNANDFIQDWLHDKDEGILVFIGTAEQMISRCRVLVDINRDKYKITELIETDPRVKSAIPTVF